MSKTSGKIQSPPAEHLRLTSEDIVSVDLRDNLGRFRRRASFSPINQWAFRQWNNTTIAITEVVVIQNHQLFDDTGSQLHLQVVIRVTDPILPASPVKVRFTHFLYQC